MPYTEELRHIRKIVNRVLWAATLAFVASISVLTYQYAVINRSAFEARWFPPVTDWTFRDWREEADGHWSAQVYIYKARPECIFVRDQVITARYKTVHGALGEALVLFEGDPTPGGNRPRGWQRLDDRVHFHSPVIEPGTLLRGAILHQCQNGIPTSSEFERVVVGVEMPWPRFVQDWIDADMAGEPEDYR